VPKTHINPNTLFPSLPHGFSQIVTAQGGKTVYLSGQTAWDAEKRIVGGRDLAAQARQVLRNVQAAMEAVRGGIEDVVFLRIYSASIW
jgi:enamine deaminase RidA (YjgF/YER057c/UK114 family)